MTGHQRDWLIGFVGMLAVLILFAWWGGLFAGVSSTSTKALALQGSHVHPTLMTDLLVRGSP